MSATVPIGWLVLGAWSLVANQPKIGFVNQCRGFERLSRFLLREPLSRELAQLVVDERQKLFGGGRVALLDGRKDARDLAHDTEDSCWIDAKQSDWPTIF